MRARVRKAFTLVEILIVVVILGILAAIVVPQFTNATEDAQAGNIQAQLDTLQNQIELYAAKNGSVYPDLVANQWADLLTPPAPQGSYIKAAPRNPACPGTNAQKETVAAAPAANTGWAWDAVTRTLTACYFDEATGRVTPGVP